MKRNRRSSTQSSNQWTKHATVIPTTNKEEMKKALEVSINNLSINNSFVEDDAKADKNSPKTTTTMAAPAKRKLLFESNSQNSSSSRSSKKSTPTQQKRFKTQLTQDESENRGQKSPDNESQDIGNFSSPIRSQRETRISPASSPKVPSKGTTESLRFKKIMPKALTTDLDKLLKRKDLNLGSDKEADNLGLQLKAINVLKKLKNRRIEWEHTRNARKRAEERTLTLEIKMVTTNFGQSFALADNLTKDIEDLDRPIQELVLILPANVADELYLTAGCVVTLFAPWTTLQMANYTFVVDPFSIVVDGKNETEKPPTEEIVLEQLHCKCKDSMGLISPGQCDQKVSKSL